MTNSKELISKAKNFYENKNYVKAKSYLMTALEDNQMNKGIKLSIYVLISDIYYKINDFDNAENYLLKSINQGKSSSEIFNTLGNIYLKKKDYKNSEKSYIKSAGIDENNEAASTNLAILYHNLGKHKEAKFFYKKVLEINPKNIGALYNLSNIDQSVIGKKTTETLKKLTNKKVLSNFNLASCFYLLSDVEKKKKNFNKEINFINKANDYSFKSNEKTNLQLNDYWLNNIPKKFNKFQYSNDKKKISNEINNTYPIFIIGLPRCGSTLIESIISSGNEKVQNLGETNLVNWAFLNTNKNVLSLSNKDERIKIDSKETSKKIIETIRNFRKKENQKKFFFSEKSLENFYYIELILNVYPNVKFIHPYRNLVDNVFAIYKKFLPRISWSHSLENILQYVDNYLFIIDYFKKKYSEKIFSISLENFTKNPRGLSKEIYKFCNLKWSENCLDFYKRDDLFINTASNNQIRSSVESYDDDKYKPYKKILDKYRNKYIWLDY